MYKLLVILSAVLFLSACVIKDEGVIYTNKYHPRYPHHSRRPIIVPPHRHHYRPVYKEKISLKTNTGHGGHKRKH